MDRIMTALSRQRGKRAAGSRLSVPGLLGILLGLLTALWPVPGGAATTERIVTDPLSGLAISGFDPVAYFTDGAPRLGSPDIEYWADGVVWRFRNEGNRAAFAADPQVYRPRFGGYDPVAIARGVGTAGHPQIWAISGRRLYLFYDQKAREAFLRDPGLAIQGADEKWIDVLRTLAP
jgi:hypothetical protein